MSTRSGDFLLRRISHLAQENEDFMLSISLLTPGGLVAGDVINRDRWLALFTDEAVDVAGLAGRRFGEQVIAAVREAALERDEDLTDDPSDFVHLVNAHYPHLGLPLAGRLWRGRVDMVCGWVLGYPPRH